MYRFATFDEYEVELAVLEFTLDEAKESFDILRTENRFLADRVELLECRLKELGVHDI